MPIEFPQNFVPYIKHEGMKSRDVKTALQNQFILEQIAKWLNHNQDFVSQSQRLRKIQAFALEASHSKQEEAVNPNAVEETASHLHSHVKDKLSPGAKGKAEDLTCDRPKKKQKLIVNEVCQGIEKKGIRYLESLDEATFLDHIPTVFRYFQMGVLSGEELISIVRLKSEQSIDNHTGFLEEICVHFEPNSTRFESIIPILDNLTEEQLFSFFSLVDHDGLTMQSDYYQDFYVGQFPYLEKLSPEHLEQILLASINSNEGPDTSFISNLAEHNFDCALRVFNRLTAQQRLRVFFAHGVAEPDLLKIVYHFKDFLTPEQVKRIFIETPCLNGVHIGKDNLEYLNHLDDLLGMLSATDLFELLEIQDEEDHTALHNPENWPILLRYLENLDDEKLLYLFSIKNAEGHTPWESPKLYIFEKTGLSVKARRPTLISQTLETIFLHANQINLSSVKKANFKDILLHELRQISSLLDNMRKIIYQRDCILATEEGLEATLTAKSLLKEVVVQNFEEEFLPILEIYDV